MEDGEIALVDQSTSRPVVSPPYTVVRPRLLVSVRNAAEARLAIAGGCDVLDVKEPARGSLGMAAIDEISAVVVVRDELAPTLSVSVALGESTDWSVDPRSSNDENRRGTLPPGIDFAKLGTAGLGDGPRWDRRFRQARESCESRLIAPDSIPATQWVAVAYADCRLAAAPTPAEVVAMAVGCGCRGVLIDTFVKSEHGLLHWLSTAELKQLVAAAHRQGLWMALAGRLRLEDIAHFRGICPDLVGVRSAACRNGLREAEIDPNAVLAVKIALRSHEQF